MKKLIKFHIVHGKRYDKKIASLNLTLASTDKKEGEFPTFILILVRILRKINSYPIYFKKIKFFS